MAKPPNTLDRIRVEDTIADLLRQVEAATVRTAQVRTLFREHGSRFDMSVGHVFHDNLIWGTLGTLLERIHDDGLCETCWGERRFAAKRYGVSHYPRDTANTVQVLARLGVFEPARRVLNFTMINTPEDQPWIPHNIHGMGKIYFNTPQLDTAGHVVLAFDTYLTYSGDDAFVERWLDKLVTVMDHLSTSYWHEPWQLIASAFCEQFDHTDPIRRCDLFTNGSALAGFRALSRLARRLGRPGVADRYEALASRLRDGIETHLREPGGMYITRRTPDDPSDLVRGLSNCNPYALRWYPDHDPAAVAAVFAEGERRPPEMWAGRALRPRLMFHNLVKAFGQMMGLEARFGRHEDLLHRFRFIHAWCREPINVLPEAWTDDSSFINQHEWLIQNKWVGYEDDPLGDWTMDSGNCEQVSVWLFHLLEDMVGIDLTADGTLGIRPAWPWPQCVSDGFADIRVQHLPLPAGTGGAGHTAGYRLQRRTAQLDLTITRPPAMPATVLVPVPPAWQVGESMPGQDVRWVRRCVAPTEDAVIRLASKTP